MSKHPHLKPCVASCRDCHIRFLTHPRNAHRTDLRCPFGCRQRHRRHSASRRSTAYYQTPGGKFKKKRLNARRQTSAAASPEPVDRGPPDGSFCQTDNHTAAEPFSPDDSPLEPPDRDQCVILQGVAIDLQIVQHSPVTDYLRLVVELIEGVRLTRWQTLDWLERTLRQHSIAYRRRDDYVVEYLNQHPP